jgi:FkbM family methyltransferase
MRTFVKRVVPAKWLWRARIRRWNIDYPDPELRWLPRFCTAGQTCVDVGAALGVYTMHMLAYASEVWAFEPRADQAERLRSTLGDDPRLHIEAVALSDKTGIARFRSCPEDSGRSTLEPANALSGFAVQELEVPVRTLDSYHLCNVGCIKIDVEGHEEAALRGAAQTLADSRPALIVELEDRHNPGITERLPQWLSGFGYQQFSIWNGRLTPIDELSGEARGYNSVFLCRRHRRRSLSGIAVCPA